MTEPELSFTRKSIGQRDARSFETPGQKLGFLAQILVYDLDETYQLEILNGERNDIEYFIPFHAIQKLEVVNKKKTKVTIKSGESIILENSVDVNHDNDGILVFTENNSEPTYIPWEDIAEINL